MPLPIAVRREWLPSERRAPLSPADLKQLPSAIDVLVQPSDQRVFADQEYVKNGARLEATLEDAGVIFGLKELPADRLLEEKVHAFFSHTIKGQPKNMPMLQHLMERRCTLFDFERITDEMGRRLVFFGHYAGVAGMVDTLWALGRRLDAEGIASPLSTLQTALDYSSVQSALDDVARVGAELEQADLPSELTPLVIGIAGDGNAARGAHKVLDALGALTLEPRELAELPKGNGIYRVTFRERDMVERRLGLPDPHTFDLQHYYKRPGRYRGVFERYLPYLNVLCNCIYWDQRYPRLVTIEGLCQLYDDPSKPVRLKVIGDISCDIGGAIEATVRVTTQKQPVYVYDIETRGAVDGVVGQGPAILAIYNLPTEFPREASEAFGRALLPFVAPLAEADFSVPLERIDLPAPLLRALIVYRGELTPSYLYLEQHL
ncbi:MAG: hypothetical protein H6707_21705 [Deltaproteobacteria bacterium]|nr:hypothetical protein [Deltaproteobacteria bacterium]